MNCLILSGDTDNNLGDLAIVTATCDELRRICPGVGISLVSSCQARDAERLGVRTIPRGPHGLLALVKAARQADLVVCGGGLFQDDDSFLKTPCWAMRLYTLRFVTANIAGLSIGAGPLDQPVSRRFAEIALRALDPVSVRDPEARFVLRPLTAKPIEIVADPTFLLTPGSAESAKKLLASAGVLYGRAPLVGVALRRWFHTNFSLRHKYASRFGLRGTAEKQQMTTFVEYVATALNRVVTETEAHIVFMPTCSVSHEADLAVCRAVGAKLPANKASYLVLDDPKAYKAVTGLMSVMLCGRMQPAILAASMGTPIVGLGYNQKFLGTFLLLGQVEQCMSIPELVGSALEHRLAKKLLAAVRNPEQLRPQTKALEEKTRAYIERLVQRIAPQSKPL